MIVVDDAYRFVQIHFKMGGALGTPHPPDPPISFLLILHINFRY
jgi:hypothetical protein